MYVVPYITQDSKTERHGSMAERILAANNPNRRFFKMYETELIQNLVHCLI